MYFYPRSPCGERRYIWSNVPNFSSISIHALLAESDNCNLAQKRHPSHFYPRSPCGERRRPDEPSGEEPEISIHALLAESDLFSSVYLGYMKNFYPRSPCGERPLSGSSRATVLVFLSTLSLRRATLFCNLNVLLPKTISIHALLAESDRSSFMPLDSEPYFYPRSPCGERQHSKCSYTCRKPFLSTLSLRRATSNSAYSSICFNISIHALLAESDFCKV